MKKSLCIILTVLLAAGMLSLAGCGEKSKAEVYFLNFKPESAKIYDEIAKTYKSETGNTLKVVTAAANSYEQTLKSEMAKKNPPAIFQINGPVGYETWKDYCADLKESRLYNMLSDKSLAVTKNGGVYGIPYVVEGYGIIYNLEILDKYFALNNRQKTVNYVSEIKDFKSLKTVVEDMSAHLKELSLDGVFASTSLASGEDWRWQTHLLNVPLYYEFANGTDENPFTTALNTKEIDFKFAQNYKNIFDLYLNNSTTKKTLLGSKSVSDSMAEFALGKAAMVQNGNWAWGQISDVKGNTVKAENIAFLPIYTGISGEENGGICIGTENYLAINSKLSEEAQTAAMDFLVWLFSSNTGKKYVTEKLGFLTPFSTFSKNELPEDPLGRNMYEWMNKPGVTAIPWVFTSFPGENFKKQVGSLLLDYAQGGKDFAAVTAGTKQYWKSER